MLERVSQSKQLTVDSQNQGTWMHINSLFYLGTRFGGVFKDQIKQGLKVVRKQFEKISKKIIVENEMRIILGLLDLINTVLKFDDTKGGV